MSKLPIVLALQIIILYQFTASKYISDYGNIQENRLNLDEVHSFKNVIVLYYNNDNRSISDLWNNIKQTAKNVWESVKRLAKDTKEKIIIWSEQVKAKAEQIRQNFKNHLKELKTEIIITLQNLFGNDGIVKKCLEKQSVKIDAILKNITTDVTSCISDKINLGNKQMNNQCFNFNDTEFLLKVEAKLNKCEEKQEQVEECFDNIRKEIAEETNYKENEILKVRLESRNIADDILDAVVTCSTEGLIEVTKIVTSVALEIINCIVQG
ncbi:unnamed protein product [Chilo suppressalis]|uniref:Uncharacterized protein n=1 Tax=Chilo suppressalis TaxID=168631 RepID=A0ABN8BE29_CHISP|nr:unnamed protein product [Chilo suppressalis]